MTQLDGRVALVPGGTRRLGAAYVRALHGCGARVVIGDLLDEEGAALADELGERALFVHLDVTSEESWAGAVEAAVGLGGVDVLVNNAGIANAGRIERYGRDQWDAVIAVNLTGTYLGCARRDVIVYDIRSSPVHEVDLWTSISLVRSLEALGFWIAIRLSDAILFNDKHATAVELADSPVPLIPSVRVTTGRDTDRISYQELVPNDWFSVFTKPASWGRGLGCVLCPDRATLDAVLGLASGSGACMLVQPSVGDVVADIRVVVVEGEVVAAYDRLPTGSSHVANVSRGATVRPRAHVAQELRDLVTLVHSRFDLPYVCVDVLENSDGQLYVSELELDGAVSALFGDRKAMDQVVGARFRAYAARLAEHTLARTTTATRGQGAQA